MKDAVRYSEGGPTVRVKLRLVEDMANGKYRSQAPIRKHLYSELKPVYPLLAFLTDFR